MTPGKQWEILNECIGASIANSRTESIRVNDIKIKDDPGMANEFTKFFTTIGPKLAVSITSSATDSNYAS